MHFASYHFHQESLPRVSPETKNLEKDENDETFLINSLRVQGLTEVTLYEESDCSTTRESLWLNPSLYEDWEHSEGYKKKPFATVKEPSAWWRYYNVRGGRDRKVTALGAPSYGSNLNKSKGPPKGGRMDRSCTCPDSNGMFPPSDDNEYLQIWSLLSNQSDYFPWTIKLLAENDYERVAVLKALSNHFTPGVIVSKIIDLALKNTGTNTHTHTHTNTKKKKTYTHTHNHKINSPQNQPTPMQNNT
eukprot:GHVR01125409.1.p1 GENE.GHVR01125409.1~~GHVR01125409.1.p1  ORF type:complete len:246 (+),score=77.82 GHVR01125409.1:498-1235(+)